MNEQKKKPIIGIGTTSIVLIFVMLCMLTFSVLSLATAQADLRLSRKSAERTTAYYDAEKYDVALADEQILCVSIELSYEGFSDGQHYRILSWNTESTHEWNNETPLPVL